ncbi:MAG TPA: histidine kinase N-terminal 7TM domain-containing protein [Anaerolineales bacterium]|nr:histidine kinase N-terminal 7TM domain-containing protein [Anaerolineales bacterium]
MTVAFSIYIIFLAAGIIISAFMVTRLWAIRKTAGAYQLVWAIFCVTVWSFGYIFEIASESSFYKIAWMKVEYIGIPFISLAIFSFTLIYSGRGQWLTRTRLGLLAIIPTVTFLLAATNEFHHLLWSTIAMPSPLFGPVAVGHGAWYNVNVAYSYGLVLLATYFLISLAASGHNLYRSQAIIMITGMVIPWIGNFIYMVGLNPVPTLDWTPLAFTLTLVAFEIGFARFGLMDILPIAQSSAFNAMRDGIIVVDGRGRIVEINPSGQNIFQQRADQMIGKHVQEIFPEWTSWSSETATAFETSQEFVYGDAPAQRTFNLRNTPIMDRRGRITGHMAILTDITDQKFAQAQMRLQATALEAAENGIVITDDKGNIQWSNKAFTHLTGYAREEAIGKNPRILKSFKQPVEYYQDLWQTVLSGKVWRGELINRRKDGSDYYEEMTITPLVQANGAITNFIAIKQDITSRRMAEEQLRQAHEEALQANRMKTQLLASVSHDLRTPLGAIMGYSEMIQKEILGPVNPDQRNAASEILDSSNQLLAFVNNLIGQAQIETGKIILRPELFKPDELVDGVRSIVGFMVKKKGLEFRSEIAPELSGQIKGDSYWLKQVLLNLVNNALKFTESGSVTVRIFKPDGSHWSIQVEDTGIGIPPEAQKTVFEAFRQVEGRARGGSGLGLAIVSQLITLMDGKVQLESEVGKGSAFTVTLPLLGL